LIQIRSTAQRGFLAALPSTLALFTLSACNKSSAPSAMAAPPAAATVPGISVVSASLSGASEVPPVTSSATGTVDATFNAQAALLAWTVTYSGMSGDVTAAHFHGPAIAGENAGVVIPITGSTVSPIKGEAMLNAAQAADLTSGKLYFNLHTAANPNGEIRGHVTVKP
jgi:CHRD domain